MKVRFFLIDLNEDRLSDRPSIRLWGVDEKNRSVLVTASQLMPHFYLIPAEEEKPNSAKEKVLDAKRDFPKLLSVNVEDRKLLGRPVKALRVVCSDTEVLGKYARQMRKLLNETETYEQDMRLSVRYVVDENVTPCEWHECEADSRKPDGASVDVAYEATTIPKPVEGHEVPRLRILAFSLLKFAEKGSARPEKDPVRAIALATGSGKKQLLIASGDDDTKLLADYAKTIGQFDPDVIVGYGSNRSDWPYLVKRSKARKVKLSVGRDGSEPHTSLYGHVSVAGRAHVDLADVAAGVPEIKVKTIENVAKFLKLTSADKLTAIDESEYFPRWNNEEGKKKVLENLEATAQSILDAAEATIAFPTQLAALTGLPLDHVMTAAVGFRVDSYLMRQAHAMSELIPARTEQPYYTYRGALVLEPETGVHENVVVLDFSSMYPNLMMKYNLSPDTLVRAGQKFSAEEVYVIPEVKHRFLRKTDGLYRSALARLISERAATRKELDKITERSTRYRVLKERERAVKIITNATYGYAGWLGARWYSKEVAESAAALGRETITKTIQKAKSLGLRIIYGDTDSLFVQNDKEKVKPLLKWVEDELGLVIRPEREYVRVLFTEAMKRYAGLMPDGSLDIVGLEVVRGDWSDLARRVQEQVLVDILRDQSIDKAVSNVRETISRLNKREIPVAELTIWKTLTKPIEDYAVRTPHVEVAKRLLKQGYEMSLGDKVAYVIAAGPGKLYQKARPPSEVKPAEVDTDYYLDNQVKPAAMRVLERFGVKESQLLA